MDQLSILEAKFKQCLAPDSSTAQPSVTPDIVSTPDPMPKSLTADRLEALLQMQKTDPFYKQISKQFSNGKAPKHETELFTHIRGLLYKHIRFQTEVPCSSHTKILEIHSSSQSP